MWTKHSSCFELPRANVAAMSVRSPFSLQMLDRCKFRLPNDQCILPLDDNWTPSHSSLVLKGFSFGP